eukprot:scaffold323_cov414-Prasinococcus_capsulatus_cf.AAC.30
MEVLVVSDMLATLGYLQERTRSLSSQNHAYCIQWNACMEGSYLGFALGVESLYRSGTDDRNSSIELGNCIVAKAGRSPLLPRTVDVIFSTSAGAARRY